MNVADRLTDKIATANTRTSRSNVQVKNQQPTVHNINSVYKMNSHSQPLLLGSMWLKMALL